MHRLSGPSEARIVALLSDERIAEANEMAAAALSIDPQNSELHNLAGICETKLGRESQAEMHWQQAIAINPKAVQPLFNLGLLYANSGRAEKAEEFFRKAIELDPTNSGALFNLGLLLLKKAPYESEQYLLDSARITPQNAAAYANLALICEKQRRWDEAEYYYRLAISHAADSVDIRSNFATFLANFSSPAKQAEAKSLFLEVIKVAPRHFGALNNLGKLLFELGYATAAKTAYTAAATYHPNELSARLNLGNVLLHLDELPSAKEQFYIALELNQDLTAAHQGLASVFQRQGSEERAAYHRDKGFRGHPLLTLDYRGQGNPVPLLVLASATGGNVPWYSLINQGTFHTTIIVVEYFDPDSPLPPHRLVFNAIGDADLCQDALEVANQLVARINTRALNHPNTVLRTGRIENARRLRTLPGVRTPRIVRLSKSELCLPAAANHLFQEGLDFPLLLRAPGYHGGNFFIRVDNPDILGTSAQSLPGEYLLAIEFLDGRSQDNLFRKFRVMAIERKLYPIHMAISREWKVHYFSSDMAENPAYRDEEAEFLNHFARHLGPNAVLALEKISDAIGLDYFGIDFGVDADENILVYETNATMVIAPIPDDAKWDYKREAMRNAFDATSNMFNRSIDRC